MTAEEAAETSGENFKLGPWHYSLEAFISSFSDIILLITIAAIIIITLISEKANKLIKYIL